MSFTPPTTDAEWNDLIVAEGLHLKWHNEPGRPDKYPESQLQVMRDSHADKVARLLPEKDQAASLLAALDQLPAESVTSILESGAMGEVDSAEDYVAEKNAIIEKYHRVNRVVHLIDKEIEYREAGTFERTPIGTTYYIDADSGSDGNAGTSTGAAWATISQFAANARSAGDIAICRRGMTANYGTGTISVTSDGTSANPIVLEADFDDAWGDFSNSAQTFTPVLGSKTMEASATITGIAAGDWVYNSTDGDDPRLFSYKVASVSGTTLTLKLPFKGSAGSGKTLKVMPDAPQLGAGGSADYLAFSGDRWWVIQGIHIYGDYVAGQIYLNSGVTGITVRDCDLQGANASCDSMTVQAGAYAHIQKTILRNYTVNGLEFNTQRNAAAVSDCLFEPGSGPNRYGISMLTYGGRLTIEDTEFASGHVADLRAQATGNQAVIYGRNIKFAGTTDVAFDVDSLSDPTHFYIEDYDGVKGDNRVFGSIQSTASNTAFLQTDTGTVRSGGSDTSLKATPGTYVGKEEASCIALFGRTFLANDGFVPIYADTTSRTYTFYFKTGATTDWTANPTASELFIEARYWGHASNVQRIPIRSTGTVSFTTTTDWQSIALTVQPAQTGLIYMRVVYGKTKESGKSNVFYFDPIPVVS